MPKNSLNGEVKDHILQYLLGGKCTFAIVQDAFQGRKGRTKWYTIKKGYTNTYLVYSESVSTDSYMGYFRENDLGWMKELRRGMGRQPNNSPDEEHALVVVLNSLKNKGVLPGNGIVHIISDGRCSVCRRKLTDLTSIQCGMGPLCRERLGF